MQKNYKKIEKNCAKGKTIDILQNTEMSKIRKNFAKKNDKKISKKCWLISKIGLLYTHRKKQKKIKALINQRFIEKNYNLNFC